MKLTRAKIEEYKDEIEGLNGYYLIVKEIEDNLPENPDICIESCKSLIEGLCKKTLELISDKYNGDKQLKKACEGNMSTLVKTAFNEVYTNSIDSDLHQSLYKIIQNKNRVDKLFSTAKVELQKNTKKAVDKITAIRHDRGDISHGRSYPKQIESELHSANSILSITDGICSFMIHELARQYQIKQEMSKMLMYKEEKEYNEWLDDQNDNLLTKIDFSRLLYDNNYEKYEEIYYAEYQDYLETLTTEEPEDTLDTHVEEKKPREIEALINTFQEEEFWTDARNQALTQFVEEHNLKLIETKDVIEAYLFTDKWPLPDTVIATLNEKPPLKERRNVSPMLTKQIVTFANGMRGDKE